MNDQVKQMAERLKGLRESMDLSPEEMAERCRRPVEEVLEFEGGARDIPIGYLFEVAGRFGVEPSTLISGDEPRMSMYFLTRRGRGAAVERTKAYRYQGLASGFKQPRMVPLEVWVEPKEEPVFLNSHEGEEFNHVLEGRLELHIGGRVLTLEEGDSVYFDSSFPHGMRALDDRAVRFLAVVVR
jgi:quercetin dioxygenase-like cupin family protein